MQNWINKEAHFSFNDEEEVSILSEWLLFGMENPFAIINRNDLVISMILSASHIPIE